MKVTTEIAIVDGGDAVGDQVVGTIRIPNPHHAKSVPIGIKTNGTVPEASVLPEIDAAGVVDDRIEIETVKAPVAIETDVLGAIPDRNPVVVTLQSARLLPKRKGCSIVFEAGYVNHNNQFLGIRNLSYSDFGRRSMLSAARSASSFCA